MKPCRNCLRCKILLDVGIQVNRSQRSEKQERPDDYIIFNKDLRDGVIAASAGSLPENHLRGLRTDPQLLGPEFKPRGAMARSTLLI